MEKAFLKEMTCYRSSLFDNGWIFGMAEEYYILSPLLLLVNGFHPVKGTQFHNKRSLPVFKKETFLNGLPSNSIRKGCSI